MAVNQDDTAAAMRNSRIRRLLLRFKESSKNLILSATRTATKTVLMSPNKTGPASPCRNSSFSDPNDFSASEMGSQRNFHNHSPRHSIDSMASSDSNPANLLPDLPSDLLSSAARPPNPPGSPHFVCQSHTKTPSYDVGKRINSPKMSEIFDSGLHPSMVTIADNIDTLDPFNLAKLSKDISQKLSTRDLHGTFQIHHHDLTEGSIVDVPQSRGGLGSFEGSSGHNSKPLLTSPMAPQKTAPCVQHSDIEVPTQTCPFSSPLREPQGGPSLHSFEPPTPPPSIPLPPLPSGCRKR